VPAAFLRSQGPISRPTRTRNGEGSGQRAHICSPAVDAVGHEDIVRGYRERVGFVSRDRAGAEARDDFALRGGTHRDARPADGNCGRWGPSRRQGQNQKEENANCVLGRRRATVRKRLVGPELFSEFPSVTRGLTRRVAHGRLRREIAPTRACCYRTTPREARACGKNGGSANHNIG